MSEENQTEIPRSFIALFVPPGRLRPTESRAFILARYEFCEDLATMLVEHARNLLFDLGITEQDVLERCHRGLVGGDPADPALAQQEADWIVRRLAELLGWDDPGESPYRPAEGPSTAGSG
ncbi:MAG: ATPase with chaperone activity [Lautropia sp.]